jgi:hypothetical protein
LGRSVLYFPNPDTVCPYRTDTFFRWWQPPRADVHPMRVIFMITREPSPSLRYVFPNSKSWTTVCPYKTDTFFYLSQYLERRFRWQPRLDALVHRFRGPVFNKKHPDSPERGWVVAARVFAIQRGERGEFGAAGTSGAFARGEEAGSGI